MKKAILALTVSSYILTACASSADNISAQYVSPLQYQDYSCKQIRMEMQRIGRRVNEIAGIQDGQATKDSVALGVGLVLFWPALFFMIGKDKEEELSRLKGEYEALESAAIQKDCDVAKEIKQSEQMKKNREKKKLDQKREVDSINQ